MYVNQSQNSSGKPNRWIGTKVKKLTSPSTRPWLQVKLHHNAVTGQDDLKTFYKQRDYLKNTVPRLSKPLLLGQEHILLREMIIRCSPSAPWSWVQTGTQSDWAKSWGMSTRTLKRHLNSLRESGWVTTTVEATESTSVRKKERGAFEFPVHKINLLGLEYALMWDQPGHWPAPIMDVLRPSYQQTVKGQIGTYTDTTTPVHKSVDNFVEVTREPTTGTDSSQTDSLWIAGLARDVYIKEVIVTTSTRYHTDTPQGKTLARRAGTRCRRRKLSGATMSPEWIEPIRSGGDDVESHGRSSKKKDTTLLFEHFESEWDRMRQDNAVLARSVPGRVAPGTKPACLSWFKKDLLKRFSLEQAKDVVSHYVNAMGSGRSAWEYKAYRNGTTRPPWIHLQHLLEATVLDMGDWVSAEDAERINAEREDEARKASEDAAERAAAMKVLWDDVARLEDRMPVLVDTESSYTPYWWTAYVGISESLTGVTYVWDGDGPERRLKTGYIQWLRDNPDVARDRYESPIVRRFLGVDSVPSKREESEHIPTITIDGGVHRVEISDPDTRLSVVRENLDRERMASALRDRNRPVRGNHGTNFGAHRGGGGSREEEEYSWAEYLDTFL